MNFCYIHPEIEAQGQCTGCNNWICSRDYHLLDEVVGKVTRWEKVRNYNDNGLGLAYNDALVTRTEMGPIIYCTVCFEKKQGTKSELTPGEGSLNPNKMMNHKKVLMCTQCGEKLSETDKFCPNCGDSTTDEFYDADNPLGGVQSSKKLKQ